MLSQYTVAQIYYMSINSYDKLYHQIYNLIIIFLAISLILTLI